MSCPSPIWEPDYINGSVWPSPFVIGPRIPKLGPICVGQGPTRPVLVFFIFIYSLFLMYFLLKYDWIDVEV